MKPAKKNEVALIGLNNLLRRINSKTKNGRIKNAELLVAHLKVEIWALQELLK